MKLTSLSLLLCWACTSAFTVPCQSRSRIPVCPIFAEPPSGDEEPVPEALKSLLETPEIMELLQSEKMREAMQLVMAGKQDELQERVKEDPEFQEIVEKLGEILGDGQ